MAQPKVGNQYHWSERPRAKDPSHRPDGSFTAQIVTYVTGRPVTVRETGAVTRPKNAERVEAHGVELPAGAPTELRDLDNLSAALEAGGPAANSRTCRTADAALPRDLTAKERKELTGRMAKALAEDGMVVAWGIHVDPTDHNPHAHFVMSHRPIKKKAVWNSERPGAIWGPKSRTVYKVRKGPDERECDAARWKVLKERGWEKVYRYTDGKVVADMTKSEAKKQGEKDHAEWVKKGKNAIARKDSLTSYETKESLKERRKLWEKVENGFLDEIEKKDPSRSLPRVDCRSYKDRSIDRIPTEHVGTGPQRRERVVVWNEIVRKVNDLLDRIRQSIERHLAEARRLRERRWAILARALDGESELEARRFHEERERERAVFEAYQTQADREFYEGLADVFAEEERPAAQPVIDPLATPEAQEAIREAAERMAEMAARATDEADERGRLDEARRRAAEKSAADAERAANEADERARREMEALRRDAEKVEAEIDDFSWIENTDVPEDLEEWVDLDYADDFETDWQPSYDERDER